MSPAFLCDENVEERTVSELAKRGFSAIHVVDDPGKSSSDAAVADSARRRDAILVTNDRDFLDRSAYPDIGVFYYPENDLPAHRVAIRVAAAAELISDLDDLRSAFYLTAEFEPG